MRLDTTTTAPGRSPSPSAHPTLPRRSAPAHAGGLEVSPVGRASEKRARGLRTHLGKVTLTLAGRVAAFAAAFLFGLGFCRSVDPGPDHDRAVDENRAVTWAESVFHPDTPPAESQERVAELLADGLELSEPVELGLLNNPARQASFHSVGKAHADRCRVAHVKTTASARRAPRGNHFSPSMWNKTDDKHEA